MLATRHAIIISIIIQLPMIKSENQNGDVVRDPIKMELLLNYKVELNYTVFSLKDIMKNSKLLKEVDSFLSSIDNVDYHDIKIGGTDDIDRKLKINHIISNPIHIYNLIKEILMFTNEIYPLLSDATLQSDCEDEIIRLTQDHMNRGMELPTRNDLLGAVFSLWILPLIYRFHPIEIVDGKLGWRRTNSRIMFEDILLIADECLSSKSSIFLDTKRSYFQDFTNDGPNYAVAIEWLEAAEIVAVRERSRQHERKLHVWNERLVSVRQRLSKLKDMHDLNFPQYIKTNISHHLPSPEKFFLRKFDNDKNLTSSLLRIEERELESNLVSSSYISNAKARFRDFSAGCCGKKLRFAEKNDKLYNSFEEMCFVSHMQEPYLQLSPVKVEIIKEYPVQVLVYHSILTMKEIEKIKSYIIPEVDPTTNDENIGWNYEITELADHHYLPVYRINRRLEKITGLQITNPSLKSKEFEIPLRQDKEYHIEDASGDLVVRTFTPTGFQGPGSFGLHYDGEPNCVNTTCFNEWKIRISSAVFFLSNVEGGGVVFPNIGRVVYPEMGSVLFWLNTHDDGRLNEYSLHGVCPVLFGIRTTAIKWTHYNQQLFRKPCRKRKSL